MKLKKIMAAALSLTIVCGAQTTVTSYQPFVNITANAAYEKCDLNADNKSSSFNVVEYGVTMEDVLKENENDPSIIDKWVFVSAIRTDGTKLNIIKDDLDIKADGTFSEVYIGAEDTDSEYSYSYGWSINGNEFKLSNGLTYNYSVDGDTLILANTEHDVCVTYKRVIPISDIVGKWQAYKVNADGVETFPTESSTWQTMMFSFNSDYTGEYRSKDKTSIISWQKSGNIIYVDGLKLEYDGADLILIVNVNENEVVFYLRKGNDNVADSYILGDPNDDGKIDANDASFVLVEYANVSTGGESALTPEETAAADVNKDGKVDAKDASAILAYYSYLSTGGTDTLEAFLKPKEE